MMKNNPNLKKQVLLIMIVTIFSISLFHILKNNEYNEYVKNYNRKINSISNNIKDTFPNITNDEIIKIVKTDNNKNEIFSLYGYDLNKESIIEENNKSFSKYFNLELIIIVLSFLLIIILYLIYNYKKDKEIENIMSLINQINNRDFNLKLDDIKESKISSLKDEIYKMMIMLKSSADNSLKDKVILKKYLEDISHQLRTPLTTILINMDNLSNSSLDKHQKELLVRKIKREIIGMKNLIESILKLSKFDVNVIKLEKRNMNLNDLINESIENVIVLSDLKNVKINVIGNENINIIGDFNWEKEAITNIIKNAVEHSFENETVNIKYEDAKTYVKLEIENIGEGMSKDDIKHIFERFYKGKNSKSDSFGIGLALAKEIVERDNGKIFVTSKLNKTSFIIKYYKYL